MAIRSIDIGFYTTGGAVIVSGSLRALFPDGRVNGETRYAFVVVRNNASLTFTGPAAWFQLDTRGGAVAVTVADGAPRPAGYAYPAIDPAALTGYTTPVSAPAGLPIVTTAPPDLPAGQQVLIVVRRTLTGATEAYPETNRLRVTGTSTL